MHQYNVPQPSRQIYASSADGVESTSGRHGSFGVTLGTAIRPHNKNVEMRVAMVHTSIPHSFFYVNAANNKFKIDDTDMQIPLGNYSNARLSAVLETLTGTTVTYNGAINRFLFKSLISNFTITFPSSGSAHRLLGFDQSYSKAASTTHISTNGVDLMNGMRYVFVHCNLAFGHVVASHAGGSNNLLAQIPLNHAHNFDVIVEKPHHPLFITVQDYEIRHLEFGLTDQFGNHLDLNGAPWSVVLQVDFVRRPAMPRPPPDPRTLVSSQYYVGDVQREPIAADKDVGDDGLQGGV